MINTHVAKDYGGNKEKNKGGPLDEFRYRFYYPLNVVTGFQTMSLNEIVCLGLCC